MNWMFVILAVLVSMVFPDFWTQLQAMFPGVMG